MERGTLTPKGFDPGEVGERLRSLAEGAKAKRARYLEEGKIRKVAPARPRMAGADGAWIEAQTLAFRMGAWVAGHAGGRFLKGALVPAEEGQVRARAHEGELLLLGELLEKGVDLALLDGSRTGHVAALSAHGFQEDPKVLASVLSHPKLVGCPKEEMAPVHPRAEAFLILRPGELLGPLPLKADLLLGGEPVLERLWVWFYRTPWSTVKLETGLPDLDPALLAGVGARSTEAGVPLPLEHVDRAVKAEVKALWKSLLYLLAEGFSHEEAYPLLMAPVR